MTPAEAAAEIVRTIHLIRTNIEGGYEETRDPVAIVAAALAARDAEVEGLRKERDEAREAWSNGAAALVEGQKRLEAEVAARDAQLDERSIHPGKCPITGRPFFMVIDGLATYGGPFDSYTIPERDDDGELLARRYDHDEGGWVEWQSVPMQVVADENLMALTERAKAAEAALSRAVADEREACAAFLEAKAIEAARLEERTRAEQLDTSVPGTLARVLRELAVQIRGGERDDVCAELKARAEAAEAEVARAVADEREACALLIETVEFKDAMNYCVDETAHFAVSEFREEAAAAIRERGNA